MRRLSGTIFIAALLAMLAGSAYSQNDKADAEDRANAREQKAIDNAYKSTLDRVRKSEPVRTVDPWGNVRDLDSSPKNPKPGTAETKSGH